jgi:hypothetical protein
MMQLKQDITEVKYAIEELADYNSKSLGEENCSIKETYEYKDLVSKFGVLEEHLKDHIETIENFVCDIK